MRTIILVLFAIAGVGAVSAPESVFAQSGSAPAAPADSGSAGSGSGSGGSGSAAPPQGSGAASEPAPSGAGSGTAAPAPTEAPMTGDAAELRKTCVAAMNANPEFADSIIKKAEQQLAVEVDRKQVMKDLCTIYDHTEAQKDIATNKSHVLMAYIAMWLVAVAFVLFLWRRQMALKTEILQLRRDLEAATKDGK